MTDYSNPCERAAALRTAYFQLLSGQAEAEIETRYGEGGERVKFARADLDTLRTEMQAAETECAQASGTTLPRRRSAISLGARRRRFGGC